MPDGTTLLLWTTVAVALGFDFTNGFHDTANAVATTISTRAMSPRAAVAISAGFVAQTVAAIVIQGATQAGLPVSTTHVVSGSVMGAGATRRLAAVRWGVARRILVAWVLTIPASGLVPRALP